jgi:hypothetical protein
MDNDECYEFIRANFDKEFVEMYENLPLDIMRADVWRVAVVYINGGIYCDCDVHCIKSLAPLIQNEELVSFTEEGGGTSNFFFAAKPKHPALKEVLDLMIKKQKIAHDLKANLLVQDFGMDLFHQVISKVVKKKQLSYLESMEWVNHHFFNTWKKSEHDYINFSRTTKPITFVTTFHENGYNLYGKSWINSFIKNVASKRNNIRAVIYAHNIPKLKVNHPQITIVDYEKAFPKHGKWKDLYLKLSNHHPYTKDMTIRFSHKGAVIQHSLSTINEGYLIWADGDVVFKEDSDYSNFPDCLFTDEALACQVEDGNHVESGILIFNMEHPDIQLFTKAYIRNYSLRQVIKNHGEPYDGHVARRSLDHSRIKYIDLNSQYGRGGIQSDPNETFLHPEIKSRFTHNIGITGKRSYTMWEYVKDKDNIFKMLENSGLPVLSEEHRHILSLRKKRK